MKMLKRIFVLLTEGIFLVVLILSCFFFWVSYYIDTVDFRDSVTSVLTKHVGVPVHLKGEFNLAIYPKLSLEVLDLVVGDAVDESVPLIVFDSIYIQAKIIPLFSRKIEIQSLVVDGMQTNIVRSSDLKTNWQPLLDNWNLGQRPVVADDGAQFDVTLAEVDIVNATIDYSEGDENRLSLSGIQLRTGAIIPGQDISFSASSNFDWAGGEVVSQFTLKGILGDSEEAGVTLSDATMYASIGGDFLPKGVEPGEMTAQLIIDSQSKAISLDHIHTRFMGIEADGKMKSEDLSKGVQFSGDLTVIPFKPMDVVSQLTSDTEGGDVADSPKVSIQTSFSLDTTGLRLTNVKGSYGSLDIQGAVAMQDYAAPHFIFDLTCGAVDLDQAMPKTSSGSPLVWGDLPLGFLQHLKAKGSVNVRSLHYAGERFDAVRLHLNTDGKSINFTGAAMKEGDGAIQTQLHCLLNEGAAPDTYSVVLSGGLEVNSPASGFASLLRSPVELTGKSELKLKAVTSTVECKPQDQLVDLLQHLTSEIIVSLGKGNGRYKGQDESLRSFFYEGIDLSLMVYPVIGQEGGVPGCIVKGELHARGDPLLKSVALTVSGPIRFDLAKKRLFTNALEVKADLRGPLYTAQSNQLVVSGKLKYDSAQSGLIVSNARLTTLDSTLYGNVAVSRFDENFTAEGKVSIPEVNPHHIISQLVDFDWDPEDPKALTYASAEADFTASKAGFTLNALKANIDGMPLSGHVVGQGFVKPMVAFSFLAGKLDIDRYLPKTHETTSEELNGGTESVAPPVDLPLEFLRMLRLNGTARFEEFKLARMRLTKASAEINADKGIIHIRNISGTMNNGQCKGYMTGVVDTKRLKTALKLSVKGMSAGLFMVDVAGREYVKGLADINLELASVGRTDDDIVAQLSGTADLMIQDGSYKFTGYESAGKETAATTKSTSAMAPRKRRTSFAQCVGKFLVKKGRFTVTHFAMEAPPVLHSTGSGWFSLPDNKINLAIRNDFVAVPSVTVLLKGKLSNPAVEIPKVKMLNDTVFNVLSLPQKSFQFFRDLF